MTHALILTVSAASVGAAAVPQRLSLGADAAVHDAFARLTGLGEALMLLRAGSDPLDVPADVLGDLEVDSSDAAEATLGHRGTRVGVAARELGLDDDSLCALFMLQDHALEGGANLTLSLG